MKSRTTKGRFHQTRLLSVSCLYLLAVTVSFDCANAFGLTRRATAKIFRQMSDSMSDFAEAVNGEIYTDALWEQDDIDVAAETEELLVSTLPSLLPENNSTVPPAPVIDDDKYSLTESVTPCSPALTFKKFLTMQVDLHNVSAGFRSSCQNGCFTLTHTFSLSVAFFVTSHFSFYKNRASVFQWPSDIRQIPA